MIRIPSYLGSKIQSRPVGIEEPTLASIGRSVGRTIGYAVFRFLAVCGFFATRFFAVARGFFPGFFPWSRLAWSRLMRSITGVAFGASVSSYSISFPFIFALMIFIRLARYSSWYFEGSKGS